MRIPLRLLMSLALALPLSVALAPPTATPAVADPLSGTWSGAGTARPKQGGTERVRCRISYSRSTGRSYNMDATCAHANGTLVQRGRVVRQGGSRYAGRMYSAEHQASGNVTVSVSGNRQTVTVRSARGSATVSLTRR